MNLPPRTHVLACASQAHTNCETEEVFRVGGLTNERAMSRRDQAGRVVGPTRLAVSELRWRKPGRWRGLPQPRESPRSERCRPRPSQCDRGRTPQAPDAGAVQTWTS